MYDDSIEAFEKEINRMRWGDLTHISIPRVEILSTTFPPNSNALYLSVLASPKLEDAAPSCFFPAPFVFLQRPLVFAAPFRFYLMSFISNWNRKVTKENREKRE